MGVLVIGPRYKPTKHLTQLNPKWQWLRAHTLAAFPMWERGGTRIYNASRPTRWGDITFGAGGDWQDMLRGPAFHFAGAGIVDLGFQRIGSLGLFAASTEQWTACVRFRVAASAVGTIVARAGSTAGNRTFQMFFDRPTLAAKTPSFILRGTTTDTNWQVDDGLFHTAWVTWDGTTAKAYYDDALGVTTLGVGTAAEESQNMSLAGRTLGTPGSQITGDIDFIALTDFAANPPLIYKWHHDLYAPWRPYRKPVGKSIISGDIPGTDIQIVYAPRTALAIDRVELWSDVKANGGQFVGVVTQYFSLSEQASLSGEHTVSLSVPLSHPIRYLVSTPADTPNLRVNQVLRLVKTDGTWSEHRISETTRQNQKGERRLSITARSIFQDLGFRGIVTRVTADGSATANFEVLSLELADQIQQFILPALAYAGARHFEIGTLEFTGSVDMVYDRDTPLSALKKLAGAAGDLELQVVATENAYQINMVKQIGLGLPKATVRAKRDLVELGFAERSDDQANRVYCFGAPYQDIRPSVGAARWDVLGVTANAGGVPGLYDITLGDPSGGEGPIKYDGQFLPADIVFDDPDTEEPETLPRFHLQWTTGNVFMAPILATFAATQKVRIQTSTFFGAAPPAQSLLPAGYKHKVRIVADGLGTENLAIDHPTMISSYGVRVATLDRSDIPGTDNLFPNPIAKNWPSTSPLPTGWQFNASDPDHSSVARETDPRYAEHGGNAIRMSWISLFDQASGQPGNAQLFGLVTPIAVLPYQAQGYLSFFARITTLSGRAMLNLYLDRKPTLPDGTATQSFPFLGDPTSGIYRYIIPANSGGFQDPNSDVITDVKLPDVTTIQLNTAEDVGVAACWDLTRYPLYGGTALLQIVAARDFWGHTECVISGVQLTVSSEQLPLFDGNGGVKLHQAANSRIALYGAPAPVVTVNTVDLAYADGLRFPFPQFQLGAPITIEDPDTDVSIVTRCMGVTRDWTNRTMPSLELSNERRDITKLLAAKPRAPRHQTKLVPKPSRGLTYEP
jgi:hypothetical protein